MDGEQKKARSRPWTGSGRREKKEWIRLWGPCVSEMKRGRRDESWIGRPGVFTNMLECN
jgi:hypothetical protein